MARVHPDLLSIILVTATQARGSVLVHQKMFESRLFFVDKPTDMGAQIILCDPHRATVIGPDRKASLRGVLRRHLTFGPVSACSSPHLAPKAKAPSTTSTKLTEATNTLTIVCGLGANIVRV